MPYNATINVTANANEFVSLAAELGQQVNLNSKVNATLSAKSNVAFLIALHENHVAANTTIPIIGLNADSGTVKFTITGEPVSTAHFLLTTDITTITMDRITITTDQVLV